MIYFTNLLFKVITRTHCLGAGLGDIWRITSRSKNDHPDFD